jgi:hypothetical protein
MRDKSPEDRANGEHRWSSGMPNREEHLERTLPVRRTAVRTAGVILGNSPGRLTASTGFPSSCRATCDSAFCALDIHFLKWQLYRVSLSTASTSQSERRPCAAFHPSTCSSVGSIVANSWPVRSFMPHSFASAKIQIQHLLREPAAGRFGWAEGWSLVLLAT